jgi:D-sedoheptulose 7-phosphate isomerase
VTTWQQDIDELHALLGGISFRDGARRDMNIDQGFARWRDLTVELRDANGTIYLIGNGASASMASHFAADLAKNGHLHTEVFSDLSLITAISNDISYEQVFAEPLRRRGRKGDMLVAISSSGRSPNILAAVEVARDLGMTVVTLSGMKADNPLRSLGALNAYVAASNYGMAEKCHAAILHRWMDLVEIR